MTASWAASREPGGSGSVGRTSIAAASRPRPAGALRLNVALREAPRFRYGRRLFTRRLFTLALFRLLGGADRDAREAPLGRSWERPSAILYGAGEAARRATEPHGGQ